MVLSVPIRTSAKRQKKIISQVRVQVLWPGEAGHSQGSLCLSPADSSLGMPVSLRGGNVRLSDSLTSYLNISSGSRSVNGHSV